ncbi:sugar-binding protein [Bombilactobacillus folatiphilus]|uniref:Sugar-binding protein n=1 Tax=Bombilactobacillus folatiphilus TaxID=2923362 RepID=A0ABY4P762_9LACO|nr:sugar-binding domain-containing protein [Bombilactobacillus folatiphilus]UQS81457.1 sugar-binding protein [Bombilactobacillus folatiphilus]
MTLSNAEKMDRLIKIAKLYYEKNYSQQEISAIVHIHRTEISRLLTLAKKMGIVRTIVRAPINSQTQELSDYICQNFDVKQAVVVPTDPQETYQDTLNSIALYANEVINNYLTDNCVVGLSWGKTLEAIVNLFYPQENYEHIKIVPLIGGPLDQLEMSCQANSLVSNLSRKIPNSTISTINAPAFIRSLAAKKEILATKNNRDTVNSWKKVNLAIVGIGSVKNVTNNWHQFYKQMGVGEIYPQSMVGDILSQAYSLDGTEYQQTSPNLVGMELTNLKKISTTIAVATGSKKIDAILGGLRAQIFNVLITTDKTVQQIQNQINNSQK